MRIEEGENIAQYVARIKEVVSAIKGAIGHIDDKFFLSKVLRTLLPIYAIRVSTIQELRCIPGKNLTLDGVVGRITTFELSNFENYKLESLESTFKAKLMFKYFYEKKKRKKRRMKHVCINSDTKEEDDFDENDDEVVYVAMKDESDEDEATTLVTYVRKNDKWIIDNGFHITL